MSAADWLALPHLTGLAVIGAVCLAALILARELAACAWRRRPARRVRTDLHAEAERLAARLPHLGNGCDPEAPCSLWDFRGDRPVEVLCRNHLPAGRHHPPPLRYGPEPVVADITWDRWEKEMQP